MDNSLTEKQSSHGREKFPGRHMSMFKIAEDND